MNPRELMSAIGRPASFGSPLHAQSGFSLIELMVGLVIGLLSTLVISTVLTAAEGQRRGTTQGADALITGSLALHAIQREVAVAGYGFSSEPNAIGCVLDARFNGAPVAIGAAAPVLPQVLAPVIITPGAAGASDQLRVLSSSKQISTNPPAGVPQVGFSVATRTVAPNYAAGDTFYWVYSSLGTVPGDLMVSVVNTGSNCEMFQATGLTARTIQRATVAPWNSAGFPTLATQAPCVAGQGCAPVNASGSLLVNMGAFNDLIFSVDGQQRLTMSQLNTAQMTRTVSQLQGGIMQMKALYGWDTDGNGSVDTYNAVTPAALVGNQGIWQNLVAVRVAVVARSAQYEKEEVTFRNPVWDVGTAAVVAGSVACGESMCVELKVDGAADWKHYRYQVFDTLVPLRNQRWHSAIPVPAP
jgi:type IV pilus assembly protein PilW